MRIIINEIGLTGQIQTLCPTVIMPTYQVSRDIYKRRHENLKSRNYAYNSLKQSTAKLEVDHKVYTQLKFSPMGIEKKREGTLN